MKAIEDRDPSMLLTSNAKALRDGTNAVAYQITNDILPSLSNPLSPTNPNELRTSVPKAASQIFNAVQTQVDNFRRGDDVADRVKEGMNVVAKSVRDAVAMEGDEGPPYEVLEKGGEFEVRKYSPYSVAETSMREVGGKWDENDVVLQGVAFNLLAGYVFGGNEERKTMELKMPVETTSLGSMRFYLGPRGDDYPTPLKFENKINEIGAVVIEGVEEKVVAVRTFKGFVTQQESERQLKKLLETLESSGVELDVPHGERVPYIVSRFNPPYTVPVVRRNEIAVPVVSRGEDVEGGGEGGREGLEEDEVWEMIEAPSDVE